MQVNEQIYGLKENWTPRAIRTGVPPYPVSYPEDEKLKLANFLNIPLTTSDDIRDGCVLGSAIYKTEVYDPTFDIGRPIPDMSICFTGLSGYSPYCKIKLISTRTESTASPQVPYAITDEAIQEYDIFNFCYSSVTGQSYGEQQKFWAMAKGDYSAGYSVPTVRLIDTKWSPEPINIGLKSGSKKYYYTEKSSRNTITFITQLPVKHIVLIPFIKARTVNNDNQVFVDLDIYLNTYKISHPQILEITLRTYSSLTDTGFAQSNIQLNIHNFNILDTLKDYYAQVEAGQPECEKQPDLMIPYMPVQGIRIGGCITGEEVENYYNAMGNAYNNNLAIYAYIDCVDLKWDSFSGDGEPNTNNHLICNAANYTVEQIKDSVYKATACFGLFFTDSSSDVYNMYLDDEEMCLGILRNGIGYGQWTNGIRNRNQPQWNWKDLSESPYVPTPPSPPDNWKNNGRARLSLDTTYLANHWYYISDNQLKYVLDAINGVDLENFNKSDTFGLNPIEGVLQLRRVYMSAYYAGVVLDPIPQNNIAIGLLQVPMNDTYAASFLNNQIYTYECVKGYYVSEPTTDGYNDFRTYQPFATGYFYDAFCGVIEIDPAKFLNKYITITQTVDFISGDKITSLFASESSGSIGERIATLTGNCAEELPINGIAAADYLRNKFMLKNQLTSQGLKTLGSVFMGVGGATISAVTGNPIGAALQIGGTILNTGAAGNEMMTTRDVINKTVPPIARVQNGTSNVEAGVLYRPSLFLTIPKMQSTYNESEYGDKTGFSGYKIATLQSCGTGTHIVSHPRISISGTVQEERMIIDQLQKGIYVKSES